MKVVHEIQDFKVPKGIEDHLFRITQEAISNTLRHSNGTKVTVELFNKDDYLLLRIQDNGKGFNVDEKLEQSYGLKNMRERAFGNWCNVPYCIIARFRYTYRGESTLNKEDSYDD